MNVRLRRAMAFGAFQWRRLELLGRVGLMLCIGAFVYALVELPRHRTEAELLREDIARVRADRLALEAKLSKDGAAEGIAANTKQSTIVIPKATETPTLLLTLEDIARRHGLQVRRSDYRYVDPAPSQTKAKVRSAGPSRFVEVRIHAPTSGSYGDLRGFLREAMHEIPTLSLDDISLKRESIGKGEVQAVLRFSLFARNAT